MRVFTSSSSFEVWQWRGGSDIPPFLLEGGERKGGFSEPEGLRTGGEEFLPSPPPGPTARRGRVALLPLAAQDNDEDWSNYTMLAGPKKNTLSIESWREKLR